MTRYMFLDELLSNKYRNYSISDLTDEVNKRLIELYPDANGVGKRTIQKDIKYLEKEGPFSVEIERYSVSDFNCEKQEAYTKHCLRYADSSFSIFKKPLSSDEKYLLREALSLLGQFDGIPNLDGLERLRPEVGLKNDDRKIVSFTKNPLENKNLFGILFVAISQRQVIELHYHTFAEHSVDRATVLHPHLLKEYNRRWFLFATADADGKLLCFALDRIDSVKPLPSRKYVEFDGNLNVEFDDIIGVTICEKSPLYKIIFWVSDHSKDYVATKPLHESQRNVRGQDEARWRQAYPHLEGGRLFRIDCKENYELIRELTSFGADLVVLSPKELREKIQERISNMQKIYK